MALKFELPKLPYGYKDLEPQISEKTLLFHHDKHHQTYLDKFNTLLEELKIGGKIIEEIFLEISKYPESLKNNGGGFWNHDFYFDSLAKSKTKPISKKFSEVIVKNFGSFEEFKKQFSDKALNNFGSGWTWLGVRGNGELAITNTKNQENPLMDCVSEKVVPILTIDVWEHAYYLDYQNRRADYIAGFFEVVNWEVVEERYKKALPSKN